MILFVASVLFLKVLCLIDGDAKDEEDARSTKDILFDDVLCVLCYPPTCLSCEENDSSIRFSRDGKPYDSTTYFARVRSIFSLLLLLLLVLLLLLLLCCCCCCYHRGYQTWFTTRLFLLRPVSRGTSQTPRETLSRMARRVRRRVRTFLISPGYKIYLLSDQIGLE